MRHVDKWELNPFRLATVRAYAKEYPYWIKKRAYMSSTTRSQRLDEPQGNAKGAGRPTENLAIKRAQLSKKIDMIEKIVREVDPFIYKYLLKGVTEGTTYEKLQSSGMTCSRNTYYSRRREFYYKLSQKMRLLGV
ncbi:MAG: hypothetical protein IJR00_08145 [Lachnospiraceae bacterium]|nr:hypothetical protein [Lachnospiraceae bacterium]